VYNIEEARTIIAEGLTCEFALNDKEILLRYKGIKNKRMLDVTGKMDLKMLYC
jgi:hypothetical protein